MPFTKAQEKLIKKLETGSISTDKLTPAERRVEDQLHERGCVQYSRDPKTGIRYVGLIPEHVALEREFG